jgi:hypothetical protein
MLNADFAEVRWKRRSQQMRLWQLVYVSQASNGLSEAELRELAATSNRANAQQSITGLLLYSRGHFMQLLEGDEPVIRALFCKIELDRRHTDVELLHDAPVESRLFAKWNMGLINLDQAEYALDRSRLHHVLKRARIFREVGVGAPGIEALELLKQFRVQS